jgi:iron(III) transport system substrate-binding protein
MSKRLAGLAACLALSVSVAGSAWADNLTDETKKLLQEMNLSEDLMNGLDAELAVPQEWIDKAMAEEGPVRLQWNTDETFFAQILPLFEARYPFIELQHEFATGAEASTKPRLAFAQGTITMDVANTIGREHALWAEIDGFEDLSDLPAVKSLVDGGLSEDKLTAAYGVNAYCLAYNTDKVKPEELPATWDDLVSSDRFGDGKLAVNVNMTVWLPYLVYDKGWDWGVDFMEKFYALKPQRRREGFQMVSKLLGLGEFEMATSQADKQIVVAQAEGSPVQWYCPDPVPLGFTEIAIIKGNPRPYSSKIVINWLLSREAQLAEYKATSARPGHRDLFPILAAFPDVTEGKRFIPKNAEIIDLTAKLIEPWGKHFEAE